MPQSHSPLHIINIIKLITRWCRRKPLPHVPIVRCAICQQPLHDGQLIGCDINGHYIHAGFQDNGAFCETGGVACGWWNGTTLVPF